MLKACSYCGKIHHFGAVCSKRPRINRGYQADKGIRAFRSSQAWAKARAEALGRDYHLCRMCFDGTYGDYRREYGGRPPLEVHHIVPLAVAFDKRTELDNLITLCPVHHKMCDRNEVPVEYLRRLLESPPGFEKN